MTLNTLRQTTTGPDGPGPGLSNSALPVLSLPEWWMARADAPSVTGTPPDVVDTAAPSAGTAPSPPPIDESPVPAPPPAPKAAPLPGPSLAKSQASAPEPPAAPAWHEPAPNDPLPSFSTALDDPEAPAATGDDPYNGWDFETPASPAAFEWNTGPEKKRWWIPITAGGVALVAIAVTAVLVMGGEKKRTPPPPPPPAPASATPIAPELLAAHQPQKIAVSRFSGRMQVTWEPPQNAEHLAGYMVAAQSADGQPIGAPQLVQDAERIAVFTGPASAPGTCAVVVTLVSGGPSLALAKSEPVCPENPSPKASASPSGKASPGATPGAAPGGAAPSAPAAPSGQPSGAAPPRP